MHYLSLPVLAIVASCSFPQHIARRTIEETFPASGLRELHCTSHNGDITIHGRAGAADIRMVCHLSIRGHSQIEADRNLEMLSVGHEIDGDRLELAGTHDRSLSNMSPSFTFVLEAPPELISRLVSHNGDLHALGIAAALDGETHNGDIEVRSSANDVRLVSHNGDVEVDASGSGALNGSIVTHNGNVKVGVAEGMGTSLRAGTHNGRIRLLRRAEDTSVSRRRLDCRIGDGAGHLEIETHNGNIEIR